MTAVFARITQSPINDIQLRHAVDEPGSGAIVLFYGVVRNHDQGKSVSVLEYEAHPQAEEFLIQVVRDNAEQTGLSLAAWHRVGSLQIGDAALVVAASAAHRPEAFAATEQLVKRIKAEVPIWKRQHYASGISDWVGL